MSALPAPACLSCRHFQNAPQSLEAAFPGLASLSSGFAAVRLNDGLCAQHDRYVTASNHCVSYAAA
jgi:hypothetical protein